MDQPPTVDAREVRLLDGPNLYFPKAALKVRLGVGPALALHPQQARRLATVVGMPTRRPGAAGSTWRLQLVARSLRACVRTVLAEAGVDRVAVRSRTGPGGDEVVVAVPWRHRGRAEVAGALLAPLVQELVDLACAPGDLSTARARYDAAVADAARQIREADPGPGPGAVIPQVPVVSITGTNGKTTTTRLVAHLAMTAGLTTAWSSTDGVVVMGAVVEEGDYSGPAGARAVLATPGLDIGVLETARGGILREGLGYDRNDVAVVTNVAPDHLGLRGIDTLDQLAEVKAIVTTVTKPNGWTILNGEDPRTWAMRAGSPGRPWAFAIDPDAPALREARNLGGRAITVLDGQIVVLGGGPADALVPVVEVPITLGGLARHNVANALAGAAAALALGVPRAAVVAGLRSFLPDPVLSSGRLNCYLVPTQDGSGTVIVVLDMAHNEAGLDALLDVARGLRQPGRQVALSLGTAGDRPDEALVALGRIAGARADRVLITHKEHYLRGRTMAEMTELFREGLAASGRADTEVATTEVEAVQRLLAQAGDGDVVAVMCHSQRAGLESLLADLGGQVAGPEDIRRAVLGASGRHRAEAELEALWADPDRDPDERIAAARLLYERFPGDGRVAYEYAGTYDSAGRPEQAVPLYEQALAGVLREPYARRARVQLASTLRNLGRVDEAVVLLDELAAAHPDSLGVAAFRALALHSAGRPDEALGSMLQAVAATSTDEDVTRYRRSLAAYGRDLSS